MLKSKQLIFLIILIGVVSSSRMAFGQISTNQEIDSLICKPWKLKIYEIDGINQVLDTLSNDRLIFHPDHSLELDLDDETSHDNKFSRTAMIIFMATSI